MYRQDAYPDTLDFANVRNYRIIFMTPCQGVLFIIVFLCRFSYISFMTNLAFDTLKLARGLEEAGFKHEQALKTAEVFAENLASQVVTKDYLDRGLNEQTSQMDKKISTLDRKIDKVAATLDRKIDNVAATLDKKIDGVEAGLKADIAGLKTDMATLENRLTLRLGGMLVASIAIVAALVRFLQHSPIPS